MLRKAADTERALALLERAYDERYPWMVHLLAEPRWDPLHGEPRFESLVTRIGIPRVVQRKSPL